VCASIDSGFGVWGLGLGVHLNDLVQVRVHELRDDIDIVEVRHGDGREDVDDGNDVFVTDESEELSLAERSLGVCCVCKGVGDLLDRDVPVRSPAVRVEG
jgi:hypothetical protein